MTDTAYQPELGQMIFGQPSKEYEASDLLDAALCYIRDELARVLWNVKQRDCPSPFSNSGARFETEGLSIHAYSWGDDDQPYNLKCGDVEVSWYKYLGRGMSVNQPMPPEAVATFLDTALAIVRACDTRPFGEFDDDSAGQGFTYE